jgi:hypothetical protein
MRPSNKSRSRNKPSNGSQGQRRNVGNVINRVFDSAGPDGKVRGTPQQIIDKYNLLARDAQLSGDRVAAENYLQHAEHYSRLLGEAQRQVQEQRQAQDQRGDQGRRDDNQRPSPQRSDETSQSDAEESGLTTFDMQESDDSSGPVETPESRHDREKAARAQASASAPDASASRSRDGAADTTLDRSENGPEPSADARSGEAQAGRAQTGEEQAGEGPASEAGPGGGAQASGETAENSGAEADKPAPKKRARRKPRTQPEAGTETAPATID